MNQVKQLFTRYKMLALVFGELLQAEWKNVDLDRKTWFLPSENVKGTRGKKQDHHVFLSPFALHFFQELKTLTGDSQWCFPNKQNDGHVDVKVVSKQVGDRQAPSKTVMLSPDGVMTIPWSSPTARTAIGRRMTCAAPARP
jgi:integrase